MKTTMPNSPGTRGEIEENVRRNILGELGKRREHLNWLAALVPSISQSTLYSRFSATHPTRFTLSEILEIADALDVSVEALCLDPFGQRRDPALRLPRLDSNQKPAGIWYKASAHRLKSAA